MILSTRGNAVVLRIMLHSHRAERPISSCCSFFPIVYSNVNRFSYRKGRRSLFYCVLENHGPLRVDLLFLPCLFEDIHKYLIKLFMI